MWMEPATLSLANLVLAVMDDLAMGLACSPGLSLGFRRVERFCKNFQAGGPADQAISCSFQHCTQCLSLLAQVPAPT